MVAKNIDPIPGVGHRPSGARTGEEIGTRARRSNSFLLDRSSVVTEFVLPRGSILSVTESPVGEHIHPKPAFTVKAQHTHATIHLALGIPRMQL